MNNSETKVSIPRRTDDMPKRLTKEELLKREQLGLNTDYPKWVFDGESLT